MAVSEENVTSPRFSIGPLVVIGEMNTFEKLGGRTDRASRKGMSAKENRLEMENPPSSLFHLPLCGRLFLSLYLSLSLSLHIESVPPRPTTEPSEEALREKGDGSTGALF
ncbi:hypothetical protein CDAR_394181 [Caerostris darwini]|uniref:Uncharacterized protein n=1 Tax=Caerostris darwini TaxID=1538125 RepID=A0AAV4RH48_9ARAC|nr:hypothetical protein CDAR_394181 [Caerostris darwini]